MREGPILLVEDNPDDVLLTQRALRKNQIDNELVVLSDGEQALRYLLGDDPVPALPLLVLLDVKLPRMNGLEVLRHLRAAARTRYLPIVVLTTSTEERDIVTSYDLGANSYVRKPVDFDQFLEAVRILSMYWLRVNEPLPASTAMS